MAASTKSQSGIIEGINVTPLVDITLVLLIIFMVTAKMVVTPAVPLDLPEAAASEEIQTIFSVSVTPDGSLVVDGKDTSDEELSEKAKIALENDKELRAVIQADGDVRHRRVIAVLDTLKSAGIERVAFGSTTPDIETSSDPAEDESTSGSR